MHLLCLSFDLSFIDADSAKVAGIILVGGSLLPRGDFRQAQASYPRHFCGYHTISGLPVHSEIFPYCECKLNIDVVKIEP